MAKYSVVVKGLSDSSVELETDDLEFAHQQFMRTERRLGIQYRPPIEGFDKNALAGGAFVQCLIINNEDGSEVRHGYIYITNV